MVGKYWLAIARRAAIDAAASLHIHSREQVVIWLGLAVAAVLALAFLGSTDAAWDEIIWRGVIIALIVLLFPFVFVWKLLSVPAAIDSEKSASLASLKGAVADKQANITRVRSLTILWERGVDFLTVNITADQYPDWNANVLRWELVTLKYIATFFSQQDGAAFKAVLYDPSRTVKKKINDEHADKYLQTSARCEVLKKIIDQHTSAWTPITAQDRTFMNTFLAVFEAKALTADRKETLEKKDSGKAAS